MSEEIPQIRPGTSCDRDDALAVLRRLREAGHVAYFAGGCVRDLLLGLTPKDYDVATDAPPNRVRKLFPRTQAVGQAFGVILVKHRRSTIEVATFRTDGTYADGRRPDHVTFTTAEEDAKRRDFTINGLFLDPLEGDRVIDYVGGQADVRGRVLRAIGNPNERFEEDHLRLLRAVRFAARFGLTVEPATAWAIARHADALRRISPERVADELRRMLAPPTRRAAWTMLWEYGLVHVVMRMLPPGAGGSAAPLPTLNASRSILLAMAPGAAVSFGAALAAGTLCYRWHIAGFPADVRSMLDKPAVQEAAKAVRTTLKISNEELAEMTGVLRGLVPLLVDAEPTVARMKRFLAEPTSDGSRHLLVALAAVGLHAERIAWLTPRLADIATTDYAPTPFVTGDDLTAAGLTPGPVFKRVLDEVYDAQLEGRVGEKGEALELALRLARGP